MPHRRPLLITTGRHPFEAWPLLACAVVGGVMAVVTAARPRSIVETLPAPLLVAWLALLSLGGLAGLVGAYWRGDLDTGLIIEAAGVLAVACMCTLYVLALATVNAAQAFTAGGLLASIGAGAWHRVAQIVVALRRIDRARLDVTDGGLPLLFDPDDQAPDKGGR